MHSMYGFLVANSPQNVKQVIVKSFMDLVFLYVSVLIQTQEDPQSLSLKTADLGDTVTLHCAVLSERGEKLYWYKQSLGYVPQLVASREYTYRKIYPPYESRVTLGEGTDFSLTMSNVNKENEANYFFNQIMYLNQSWINGTFLSVKGRSNCFQYY